MALAVAILAGLVVFEYAYSLLVLSRPRRATFVKHEGLANLRTSIVLPGFSNPPGPFAAARGALQSDFELISVTINLL